MDGTRATILIQHKIMRYHLAKSLFICILIKMDKQFTNKGLFFFPKSAIFFRRNIANDPATCLPVDLAICGGEKMMWG